MSIILAFGWSENPLLHQEPTYESSVWDVLTGCGPGYLTVIGSECFVVLHWSRSPVIAGYCRKWSFQTYFFATEAGTFGSCAA